MDTAIFKRQDGEYVPTSHSEGVWTKGHLQGSAVTALLAREVEAIAAVEGRELRRLTFELWRPAGMQPLQPKSNSVRNGKTISVHEVSLFSGGTVVARCTSVLANPESVELPETLQPAGVRPEDGTPPPPFVRNWSPYFSNVSTRVISGALERPGPASAWMRLEAALVEGEANSPVVQAVQAADFAGGVSQVVDMRRFSFINPELTIHFLRPPAGDWIMIDARTIVGKSGAGMAQGQLSDRGGMFATVSQSLLFQKRSLTET